MILLSLMNAQAALSSTEICAAMNTQFTEVVTLGDYWNTNTVRPFRGLHVTVRDDLGNTVYAGVSGDSDGCVTLLLDTARVYNATYITIARVNGYVAESKTSMPSGQHDSVTFTSITANFGHWTLNVPWSEEFAQLMAATFVLSRHTFNMSTSFTFRLTTEDCCYAENAVPGSPTGTYIHAGPTSNGDMRLRMITHEIGHAVSNARDEFYGPRMSYTASMDGCDGYGVAQNMHSQNSKEHVSAAAVESWADFVTVATFNSRGDSDCHIRKGSRGDWDDDGSDDGPSSAGHLSCEGNPLDLNHDGDTTDFNEQGLGPPLAAWVSAKRWLQRATTQSTGTCSGTITDRAARHDWLRFFWDMTTDENIHPNSVATIWDTMNPRTFDPNGGGSNSDDANQRLADACSTNYATEYANQSDNGVAH